MLVIVYVVTLLFICLAIFILYMTWVTRKRAVAEQMKIRKVFDDAKRALELIESDDPNKILAGLQTLSIYDIPSIRMRAFPRLMQLRRHVNTQVGELAEHIIELSQSGELPEGTIPQTAPQRERAIAS